MERSDAFLAKDINPFVAFKENTNRFTQTVQLCDAFKELLTKHFNNPDIERIMAALTCSMRIHLGQQDRFDGPYVNHILRVGIRLIEEFQCRNADEVIASVYHDTVEDRPAEFVFEMHGIDIRNLSDIQRWKCALDVMRAIYGNDVRRTIRKVTNRPKQKINLSETERILRYCRHVSLAIQDVSAAKVKGSDFYDNGFRIAYADVEAIHNIQDLGQRQKKEQETIKLMKKYLPTIEVFKRRMERGDIKHVDRFIQNLAESRALILQKLPQLVVDNDFDADAFERHIVTQLPGA